MLRMTRRSDRPSVWNKTTWLTLTRPSVVNSPNPKELRREATSKNTKKRVLRASGCKQEGYRSWMDGGRGVGRSQRETEVEEEGRSFEEREGGRDGGGRIYLFLYFILSSASARRWWTRVQSMSLMVQMMLQRGGGFSHPESASHLPQGGHVPCTSTKPVLQHTHTNDLLWRFCAQVWYFNTSDQRLR